MKKGHNILKNVMTLTIVSSKNIIMVAASIDG